MDPKTDKYLTASMIYRGRTISEAEVAQSLISIKNLDNRFIKWIPDSFKQTLVNEPSKDLKTSATFVGFNSAIQEVFKRILDKFYPYFRYKAFLRHYT